MNDAETEVLAITERMLHAMYTADPEVHRTHCAPDMSSFEWYIAPYRIDGLDFHLKLIESGDTAIVNYTLLKTEITETAPPQFSTINETRVFVKLDGIWKMVHLHKSPT